MMTKHHLYLLGEARTADITSEMGDSSLAPLSEYDIAALAKRLGHDPRGAAQLRFLRGAIDWRSCAAGRFRPIRSRDWGRLFAELTRFRPYQHAATDVIQGDEKKILGLDIGTETQDIPLFDSTKTDAGARRRLWGMSTDRSDHCTLRSRLP